MKIIKITSLAFLLIFSVGKYVSGQVNPVKTWNNGVVKFSFNSVKGEFDISNEKDKRTYIGSAIFQVNKYKSNQGYAFKFKEEGVSDEFGNGKKVTIEGSMRKSPSILLEVYLYEGNGMLALNAGIINTGDTSLRIMNFYPLKGTAFKGFDLNNYKALDGEDGFYFTKVTDKDTLNCFNNMLVTFGRRGEQKHSLVFGGLSYNEFQKRVSVAKHRGFLNIAMMGMDPVGKLVDARSKYILKDKFYIDFTTDNRFNALEKYGSALRLATHADIKGVNFPILNFWYAYVGKFGNNEFADNSIGTVDKMAEIAKTGFLKYSKVGLRLEPDDYALPSNEQGWWDDKHWQMYKGGQLLKPYETIVKWGTKIKEMGGVPFIYCQTAKRSEDYCVQHPDQMLFNTPFKKRSKGPIGWWGRSGDSTAIYWTYDFTDPGFIKHMQDVYKNLKAGGVQGIKFDYPDTGWSYDGGFEDKYATTTSAYRNIFKLAYDGLGPNRDVQERIPPFGDVALGVVTTQRTEGDNDRAYPGRISKTGLRWYKNRVVVNYDCDPINPDHIYPKDTRDGWRAALTMTFITSGRMEIGKYFEKMTPDNIYDLSRVVPLLAAPAESPRPVDAFSGKLYPQVYDFAINTSWHILTFYNTKIEGEEWPTDVMAYWTENKQFNPEKMLPCTISVAMGDKTDDGGLALSQKKKYYVFDFWNWKYAGKIAGNDKLQQELRPGEARIMAVHEAKSYPQFISTSRHILQGYLDMDKIPEWKAAEKVLSGTSKVVAGEDYKIIIAVNGYHIKKCSANNAGCKIVLTNKADGIYEMTLNSNTNADVAWKMDFKK